jgi:hypothetical protein
MRKTISIHILNSDYFEKEKEYHNVFHILIPTPDHLYFEDHEYHFIELEKFIKNVDKPKSELDLWTSFLTKIDKHERDTLSKLFKSGLDQKNAFEVSKWLYLNRDDIEHYMDSEKLNEDLDDKIETVRKEWKYLVLNHQIRHKFGDIPKEFLTIIEEMGKKKISVLSKRILEVKTLEELFDGLYDKREVALE